MARRLAMATASSGAVLLAVGLLLAAWPPAMSYDGPRLVTWLSQLAIAASFGLVGLAITVRVTGPGARIGLALLGTGFSQAVTFATSSWIDRPGSAPAVVRWLDAVAWAPGVLIAVLVLPAIFPDGRATAGFRWHPAAASVVVAAVSALVAVDGLSGVSVPAPVDVLEVIAVGLGVGCGLASLVVRHRDGDRRVRGQIRWLVWALLVLVAIQALVPVVPVVVSHVALSTMPLLVPLAIGVAVLRFGLLDIDRLLSRTVVHLLLSAASLATYVLIVVAVGRGAGGLSRPALLAVLVVAIVAVPLREAMAWVVTRAVWGPAADRERALASLVRRAGSSPSLRESPQVIADGIAEVLRSPVEIRVGGRAIARSGPDTEGQRTVPVRHSGRVVGEVRLGQRPSGPLAAREERMLSDVVTAIGPLLDSILLTEELRREQERVVAVRDAERQRLRRDLHDGLGPTLAGIVLGVDAVRNLVWTKPERAQTTLERLAELAGGATGEVRRVVDELGAHVLDDRPLVEAIRASVQIEGVDPPVRVEHHGSWALTPDTETALLRVVLEAVNNVRKHARATRCDVRLGRDGAELVVVVDDDGTGIVGQPLDVQGVGLSSMRRRVERVGGCLELGPSPLGGTRVCARVPLQDVA
jgi:signal transduction histidine kinase